MDLDDLIIAVSCLIDETLLALTGDRRLRQRGPAPMLADSEVLTMEVVGESLGLSQDQAISDDFRRYHADCFPALRRLHRPTFRRRPRRGGSSPARP